MSTTMRRAAFSRSASDHANRTSSTTLPASVPAISMRNSPPLSRMFMLTKPSPFYGLRSGEDHYTKVK